MKLEFPYVLKQDRYYPIIDLVIKNDNNSIKTDAIVDSGAVISIFQGNVAEYIGLKIEEGQEKLFQGIGGKIIGYIHNVKIKINNIEFSCKIAFSDELSTSLNIIGRESFFDNFLITFDEKNKKLFLESGSLL